MLVWTESDDVEDENKIALFVPPKNAGTTIRAWIKIINLEWKERGLKPPLPWSRGLYKSFPQCGKWFSIIREPLGRFQSLFATRLNKIRDLSGEDIQKPGDMLQWKFYCQHVYAPVARLLEWENYKNDRRNWHQLDLCRHFLPQTFLTGTPIVLDRSEKPTGERKPHFLPMSKVDSYLKELLEDTFEVDLPDARMNTAEDYKKEERWEDVLMTDLELKQFETIYAQDIRLWDTFRKN